jgi:hypothetical protein
MSVSPRFNEGSPGIEGKWGSLQADRDALKEENTQLKTRQKLLEDRVEELEAGLGMDYKQLSAAYADSRHRLEELRADKAAEVLKFNASEQQAWDAIMAAFTTIAHTWGLKANHGELASATHCMQGFVMQRMLSRLNPEGFGSWWEGKEAKP